MKLELSILEYNCQIKIHIITKLHHQMKMMVKCQLEIYLFHLFNVTHHVNHAQGQTSINAQVVIMDTLQKIFVHLVNLINIMKNFMDVEIFVVLMLPYTIMDFVNLIQVNK